MKINVLSLIACCHVNFDRICITDVSKLRHVKTYTFCLIDTHEKPENIDNKDLLLTKILIHLLQTHQCTFNFELSTRESYDSVKTLFDNLYRAYITKSPSKPSSLLHHRTSPPIIIHKAEDQQNEQDRILAAQQRGRSRTVLEAATTPLDEYGTKHSPVTFRRLTETSSNYSSSPDEGHTFIGEQIIFDEPDVASPQPQRRITVCESPTIPRKVTPHPAKFKQRRSTDNNDYYDSNNNPRVVGSLKLRGERARTLLES